MIPFDIICSGGIKFTVSGKNFDVVQRPMMLFVHNNSSLELRSVCHFS